jgi:hypothetical protein
MLGTDPRYPFHLPLPSVPIEHATVMLGDNESVVNTASMPHSKLNKRHNCLSYHKTRSCIAGSVLRFSHIPGPTNPADILSNTGTCECLADIASLPFRIGKKEDPAIDAIKMLIKQGTTC